VEGLIAMLLGCIADYYNGATDLASMVKCGMRTVQRIVVPAPMRRRRMPTRWWWR
jgi:uncharacterized protein YgbK (DUF1537 family)